MKREKYEARGVTAATVESRCEYGEGELSELIESVEGAFFESAARYAKGVAQMAAGMSAAERRKLRCERISLSCGVEEISGITRVVFTAKHEKNGSEVTKEHSFFWDAKENIIIKKPGKNIKKAKRRT